MNQVTTIGPCAEEQERCDSAEDMAVLEGRAATYGFLARLYRSEVDAALLEELHDARYPVHSGNDDIDKGYYLIAKYLSNRWENTVDELQKDYSRSFVGHGNTAYSAAYPYESVYRTHKRLMMQAPRDQVLAIYRSEKLDKCPEWRESEDHIAVEFEFMRIMTNRQIDALRDGDRRKARSYAVTQRNFLEDHVAMWLPMFLRDMHKFAETDFYQGVCYLTRGFIQEDRAFVGELAQN